MEPRSLNTSGAYLDLPLWKFIGGPHDVFYHKQVLKHGALESLLLSSHMDP